MLYENRFRPPRFEDDDKGTPSTLQVATEARNMLRRMKGLADMSQCFGKLLKRDPNHRTQSGKMTPLELDGTPPQRPKSEYNQNNRGSQGAATTTLQPVKEQVVERPSRYESIYLIRHEDWVPDRLLEITKKRIRVGDGYGIGKVKKWLYFGAVTEFLYTSMFGDARNQVNEDRSF
jgi:hypothetical protein